MQSTPTAAGERDAAVKTLTIESIGLQADLAVPQDARGIVLFAHGSGSSRLSPRNRRVAEALRGRALGTLLFDLLTPDECGDRGNVFDIPLLAGRLTLATRWLRRESAIPDLPVAYFGASTGAAAALLAAAEAGDDVAAVVSRGGRPDLVADRLPEVRSATLLIVGENDPEVMALNQQALDLLTCEKRLARVAGASHLFEEPGTLDVVIDLAGRWFLDHLPVGSSRAGPVSAA